MTKDQLKDSDSANIDDSNIAQQLITAAKMYQQGNKAEAIQMVLPEMQNIIDSIIDESFLALPTEYREGMYHQGIIAVIKGLDELNSSITDPITFFKQKVTNEIIAFLQEELYEKHK